MRRQSPADDQQPGQRSSRHGSGGYGYEPRPAGAPPEIFQQNYGQQDPGQRDRAERGFGERGFGERDFGEPGFGERDFGQRDRAERDRAEPGFGERDFNERDRAERDRSGRGYGQETRAQEGRDPWGAAEEDHARRDSASKDYTKPGMTRDFPAWDWAPADRADADDASRDDAGRDDAGRAVDPDRVARIDPALQDFFTAKPSRADAAQPGSGQRYGGRGAAGQGAGQVPRGSGGGQPADTPPLGRSSQLGQPGHPGRPGGPPQANRGDTAATPGARSVRHQEQRRPARRGLTVGVVLGVAVLAIALVEVLLGRSKPPVSGNTQALSTATSQPTTVSTPSSSASAKARTAAKPPARKAGYVLTTPAMAGGYPVLTQVPTSVQSVASATAQSIRGAVVTDGGKVASKVSAGYQLDSGQVLAFTGYEGTFSPAKVIAGLDSLGTGGQTYTAGKDGGKLACATAPGATPGTVCVWATTTTVGITEFFSSIPAPEVVTDQAKAAADTLKFRDSVEAHKA